MNLADLLVIDPADERELHEAIHYALSAAKAQKSPDFEKLRLLDRLEHNLNVRIYGAFPDD